jgi:hypothetical protein
VLRSRKSLVSPRVRPKDPVRLSGGTLDTRTARMKAVQAGKSEGFIWTAIEKVDRPAPIQKNVSAMRLIACSARSDRRNRNLPGA